MRTLAALTATLLLLAGCADEPAGQPTPDETTATPDRDTASPTPSITLAEPCALADAEVSLRYPDGWHVNDPSVAGPCRVFNPEPFTLRDGTEIPPELAIIADYERVAMDRIGDPDGGPGVDVLLHETRQVDGRDAVRMETRATGDAPMAEPGTHTYRWLVELGPERTFVLSTTDRGDLDYREKQRIVDAMMDTVIITAS